MKNTIELTKEGLKKMQSELDRRKGALREELVNTLDELRSDGDLSENEGYKLALDKFQENETRIEELEEIVKNATVVSHCEKDAVCIGATVTLKLTETNKDVKYSIVNENEADPLENKVSANSPIGKAVLGRKKGEKVTVKTPAGLKEYQIVDYEVKN